MPTKGLKTAAGALAASAVLLLLFIAYANSQQGSTEQIAGSAVPASAAQVERDAWTALDQRSSEVSQSAIQQTSNRGKSYYASHTPYHDVISLRNRKKMGSFATAASLMQLCRSILQRLPTSTMKGPPAWAGPPDISLRERAVQEVHRRCDDFEADHAVETPLPDDSFGKAYELASRNLTSLTPLTLSDIKELSAQGALPQVAAKLAGQSSVYFDGRELTGVDKQNFQLAMALVQFGYGGMAGEMDLRALSICATKWVCDGDPEAIVSKAFNGGRRLDSRVFQIAAEIQNAFVAGSYERFLAPELR